MSYTFFCFLPITHSQTSNTFTLPLTVNTTGTAWDGDLAFDLEIGSTFVGSLANTNCLVVMDTNGTVLDLRESDYGYGAAYNIAPDTLLFQGEPQVSGGNASGPGAADAPTYATHIWDLATDTTEDFPNVVGHHDIQYDPVNNTFLTLQDYVRQVGNTLYLYDQIVQLDPNGTVIWSLDTYNFIPPSEDSPFNDTTQFNGQTVVDLTHSNSLDWDYNDSIIYLNVRNTNTFYAINQTTGNIIWACGEFGNFTLLGANGQPLPDVTGPNGTLLPPSLWYHSHDVKEVAPDVFTMFDNDYENNSNPDDCHSEMLEVTLNETSMTAYVNWSWEAPTSILEHLWGRNSASSKRRLYS